MDRPGERHMTEAFLNSSPSIADQNRKIVRANMNNSNDFNEVFLKIHEAMNDPKYEQQVKLKNAQIQTWNRDIQFQQDENRRNLGNKLRTIKAVVGSDPSLLALNQKIDSIMADYNRDISKDLSNQQFIEHNKRRNHDSLLVSDEQFSKTNKSPQFSGSIEIGRTSTVKIHLNNDNQVLRHEVDKAYAGDDIRVVQVKQAISPSQFQPKSDERLTGSPNRKGKPTRTPVKQTVEIQREEIKANLDYDKSKSSPQSQKVIYANDTDPQSSTKKTPKPVEKLIVTTNEGSMTPQNDSTSGRVIEQSNQRNPQGSMDTTPRPFSQYPVYDRRTQEPLFLYKLNEERAYYHRQTIQPPQSYNPPGNMLASLNTRPIEPCFEELVTHRFVRDGAQKRLMPPRSVRYMEQREVGIMNSIDYFKQTPKHQQIDLENVDMNKLDLNKTGNRLYVSGLGGTAQYDLQPDNTYKLSAKKDAPRMVQIKSPKVGKQCLVAQEALTNHLILLDDQLIPIGRSENGIKEEGEVKQDFKHFRHSLDDNYMLWRSGNSTMIVYDLLEEDSDEIIQNFWMANDQIMKPIAAISSADAYRIIGVSLDDKNNSVIHYYERKDQEVKIITAFDKFVFGQTTVGINSLEVSANSMVAYFAGVSLKDQRVRMPTIWACNFNGLQVRAAEYISDESDKAPIVIKRIPSYEILLIGCFKSMFIMEFDDAVSKFIVLAKLPNLHSDYIVDLAIKEDRIFSKGVKEQFVKVTQFGSGAALNTPQDLANHPMLTSVLVSQLNSPFATTSQLPSNMPADHLRYRQSAVSRLPVNCPQVLEKLALSKTARAIYAGGNSGIVMLKYDDQMQTYRQSNIQSIANLRCFGFKSTAGGYLVVQESGTNSMIVFNSKGEEKARFAARSSFDFPASHLRNPHFSSDHDQIVWFSGYDDVSVTKLTDLKSIHYNNFLPTMGPEKQPIALRSVLTSNGEKVVISFMVDNLFGVAYLHKAIKEPHAYTLADVAPGFKSLLAMDVGADGSDLVFFAGQSEPDEQKKEQGAIVSCLNLSYHLTPVKKYRLQNIKYSFATSIRRIRASCNEFLVGCLHSIVVVYFKDNDFKEITSFDDLHTEMVDDIAVYNNMAFSVCRRDKHITQIKLNPA